MQFNCKIYSQREINLCALKSDAFILLSLPEEVKKDKEYVLAAVTQSGEILDHCPSFWDDYDVARIAVKTHGVALEYIDKNIIDRTMVYDAVLQNNNAICYAPHAYHDDIEITLLAVKNFEFAEYILWESNWKHDVDVIKHILMHHGILYKYVSLDKFSNNRELIKIAVTQNPNALLYASYFQYDYELVLLAVSKNPDLLYNFLYFNDCRELVETAVAIDPGIIVYASPDLYTEYIYYGKLLDYAKIKEAMWGSNGLGPALSLKQPIV